MSLPVIYFAIVTVITRETPYLRICDLFNEAVSTLGYIATCDGFIGKIEDGRVRKEAVVAYHGSLYWHLS